MIKTKNNTIERLTSLLEQLLVDASNVDKNNALNKTHKLIENNNLFSINLFSTQSDRFYPYVQEAKQKLADFAKLSAQLPDNKTPNNRLALQHISTELLRRIEQQVVAIMTALQANQTMHQAAQLSQAAKIKSRLQHQQQNKYRQLAKKVMLSSHQLYEKLTEHHDFERRLAAMIYAKEKQLAQCNANNKDKLATETLALHQRLGRCRKAISEIEREIEQAEKIK